MKRNVRWLVTSLVVVGIVAGSLVPGMAAEPESLERLALENRVAEVIANLKLTPDQKEQLKEVAQSYRKAQSEARAEWAKLLAERRDALLANDREALDTINKAIEELRKQDLLASDEKAAEFVAGLTERQRQVLARILPGMGRRDVRMHMRELPERFVELWHQMGPGFHPELPFRMPHEGRRLHALLGADPEVIDVLIDLLER